MKSLVMFSIICALLPACAKAQQVDNTPVGNLDLEKYLGNWYEIARFDHSFERGMECTQATYSLNSDNTVRVANTGWKDGVFKTSIGKAFQPRPVEEPALLRVSFFGPFYSDYRVMMLDPEYKYSLVGSGNAKYLWILSREPSVPQDVMKAMLDNAKNRGYDTTKLIWVSQESTIPDEEGFEF